MGRRVGEAGEDENEHKGEHKLESGNEVFPRVSASPLEVCEIVRFYDQRRSCLLLLLSTTVQSRFVLLPWQPGRLLFPCCYHYCLLTELMKLAGSSCCFCLLFSLAVARINETDYDDAINNGTQVKKQVSTSV